MKAYKLKRKVGKQWETVATYRCSEQANLALLRAVESYERLGFRNYGVTSLGTFTLSDGCQDIRLGVYSD